MRLQGKSAIITGAAGAIGAATAQVYLREGADLVLTDLDEDKLQSLFRDAPKDRVRLIGGDLTKKDANDAMVAAALESFGGLDIFFANAGILGDVNRFVEYDVEAYQNTMDVNVKSLVLGLQAALPKMNDGGSIILTSSIAGMLGAPMNLAYSASKHAVIGLRRTAAYPAGERRIRVNSLHPGFIDSPMFWEAAERRKKLQVDQPFDNRPKIDGYIPPEDVANAVLFLGSDESRSITDQAIVVDRGVV